MTFSTQMNGICTEETTIMKQIDVCLQLKSANIIYCKIDTPLLTITSTIACSAQWHGLEKCESSKLHCYLKTRTCTTFSSNSKNMAQHQ